MKLKPELQPEGQKTRDYSSVERHSFMDKSYFFSPKKSYGWVSLIILSLLFGFLGWIAFLSFRITGGIGALVSTALFILLAIGGILLIIWFFNIKYELAGDKLILHFGPFAYQIDLYLIDKVEQKNLYPALGIGIIVPGFAHWVNTYRDEGKIFMCSTRAMKGIVILRTKIGDIGISPKHEDEFMTEVNKRIQFIKLLEPE